MVEESKEPETCWEKTLAVIGLILRKIHDVLYYLWCCVYNVFVFFWEPVKDRC